MPHQIHFRGEPTTSLVTSGRKSSIQELPPLVPSETCIPGSEQGRGCPGLALPAFLSPLLFSGTLTLLSSPAFMIIMRILAICRLNQYVFPRRTCFYFKGVVNVGSRLFSGAPGGDRSRPWQAPSGIQEQIGSSDFQTIPAPLLCSVFICSDVQTWRPGMPSLHSPHLLPALERIHTQSQ